MKFKSTMACAAAAAVLAACGGGGGGNSTTAAGTPDAVPESAFSSTDSFIAYVTQLVAGNSDTAEPLTLPGTAAPTTDTAEPA